MLSFREKILLGALFVLIGLQLIQHFQNLFRGFNVLTEVAQKQKEQIQFRYQLLDLQQRANQSADNQQSQNTKQQQQQQIQFSQNGEKIGGSENQSYNQQFNLNFQFTREEIRIKQLEAVEKSNATLTANNDVRYVHFTPLYHTPFFASEEICVLPKCCARSYLVPKRPEDYTIIGNFSPRELAEIRIKGRIQIPDYIDFPSAYMNDQLLPCLQPGVVIQTDGNYLEEFFRFTHPKLEVPYVLISGDTAESPNVTASMSLKRDEDKLIHWYAHHTTHVETPHPKFTPMPIGISQWKPHRPYLAKILAKTNFQNPFARRKYKESLQGGNLFVSFAGDYASRPRLRKAFCSGQQPSWVICRYTTNSSVVDFYKDLLSLNISFVLSPRGFGVDAYRTWESLALGFIPIVHNSMMKSIYEDMPVITSPQFMLSFDKLRTLMDDFAASEEFLDSEYTGWDRLFLTHWRQHIFNRSGRIKQMVQDPETNEQYYKLWSYNPYSFKDQRV